MAISGLVAPASAQTNLVQNGDFEINNAVAGLGCSAASWTNSGPGACFFAFVYGTAAGRTGTGLVLGNFSIGAATISQSVNTAAGRYNFSFWWTPAVTPVTNQSFTATVGLNTFVIPTNGVTGNTFQNFSRTVQLASGTTTVSFSNAPSQENPAVQIDDVSLTLLSLGGGSLLSLLPTNAPANVVRVATAIDTFTLNGGTLPPGFDNLFNLNGDQLVLALSQLSGEGGNGATQQTAFTAANQFINTILDPSIEGRTGDGGGATAYADESSETLAYAGRKAGAGREAFAKIPMKASLRDFIDPRWSVWAAGYGGSSSVDGNAAAGTHSTRSSIYGTAVGADYRVGRNTLVGFAMGGAGTNFSTSQGLGSGSAGLFQLGVYGRHNIGDAYVAGALAYGWQDITIDRTVTVAGLDQLRANFNTNTFAARLEAGYRLVTPMLGVTPYGAVQSTTVHLPGYAETAAAGSNQFALAFASDTTTNVRSELGVRTDKSYTMREGALTLRGRAAWAHDSNTDRRITPTFQSLPGTSFVVDGARPAPDAVLLTAGAEMKWRNGWALAGTFEGEFSQTTESYAGKGAVRYGW